MKAYIDSSVVLRVVLSQPESLREWSDVVLAVGSGLVEVECLRTIDRFRLTGALSAEEAGIRRAAVFDVLGRMELIELTRVVLHRAAQPMPAPLGTLDAIHLATAEFWREARDSELVFATHDRALGLAARAAGFQVIGINS